MSLLKSLKGTFQNVHQDIVDGFRALSALDSTTHLRKVIQLETEGISVDAGADLLYKYIEKWSEMQSYSADTAQKAEEVDQRVRALLTEWERRGQSASRLEEEAAMLPSLTSTLKDMLEVIESLHEDFQAVEEEMERLQDVAEEEEVRREQLSHHAQLATYTSSRQAEAKAVKGRLWKKLKEQSKELEGRKLQKRGRDTITEMDHLSPHSSHDPFSSEEAFIEDDYTLDYSATMDHNSHFLDEDLPISFDDVCMTGDPSGPESLPADDREDVCNDNPVGPEPLPADDREDVCNDKVVDDSCDTEGDVRGDNAGDDGCGVGGGCEGPSAKEERV